MAAVDRNIIRIAVYELKYCPEIPILVSIDEAIEISKSYATEKSGVFINGILNGVKDSLPPDAKDKGIDMDEKELELIAERYALERGGRSARAAKQLIDGLLSK